MLNVYKSRSRGMPGPFAIVLSLTLHRISVIPGNHTKVCILEFLPCECLGINLILLTSWLHFCLILSYFLYFVQTKGRSNQVWINFTTLVLHFFLIPTKPRASAQFSKGLLCGTVKLKGIQGNVCDSNSTPRNSI